MKIKNVSSNLITFSDLFVTGTLENLELAPNQELTVFDIDAAKSIGLATEITANNVVITGNDEPATGTSVSSTRSEVVDTYSGTHSFQSYASDLTLTPTAGSSTSTNPKFLAAMMGNLHDNGHAQTSTANYLGGVIAHLSIVGAKPSTYPVGALLAGISDGVTNADGAVVAYIDGDGSVTNAGAAFKVRHNNSTPGSGFNFGVDLFDPAHDGYNPVSYKVGEIRLLGEAMIFTFTGTPSSSTGAGHAGPGSLLIELSGAKLYINTGSKATPTWTVVGSQS